MDETKIMEIEENKINPLKDIFPYCLVWTTIPLLSYIFPFIGHTGICTSEGIIHDFSGSYSITIDNFIFGKPLKYIKLIHSGYSKDEWNKAIKKVDNKYSKLQHKLIRSNCHHHCAEILNDLEYKGRRDYNMNRIIWMFVLKGKYVSFSSFLKIYFPLFIFIIIVFALVMLFKYLN